MSRATDLLGEYERELRLPWAEGLSAPERVWMLWYPPDLERSLRALLPRFEFATTSADRGWHAIDISDELGRWLANHEYAEAFFADPSDLTSGVVQQFEDELVERLGAEIEVLDPDDVVALVGIGSLFPFVRASAVINAIDDAVRGRLLVFFPGQHDPETNSFRLLDARDGFNYRARAIPAPKGQR